VEEVRGIKRLAYLYKTLQREDFRILHAIERGMVYLEDIATFTKMDLKDASYFLGRLSKIKLVEYHEERYNLKYSGLDMLSLGYLYENNAIKAVGDQIGYGKESDVFESIGNGDEECVLKVHREGISFKNVLKNRPGMSKEDWVKISKKSAFREQKALKRLYPYVSVPKPIASNRHVNVMGRIDGCQLNRADLEDPGWFLDKILDEVKKSYERGIIHGDLSKYNVLVSNGEVFLIDWPQYVETGFDGSEDILKRDIKIIINHFSRKYSLNTDLEETFKRITRR
jgi:RIO-like serine/threonine protein kinase fused to N-terminal HTH domain